MNPLLAGIPPSLIRSINARKRPGDIDLGLGEPTLPPTLAHFESALEWTRANGSPYTPNAGFPELRDRIAAYLSPTAPALGGLTAANVCVTVGSEEALYLAIKTVVDPARDEVLIVEPCYLAYQKICVMEGATYRMVPLHEGDSFRPSAQRVLEAVTDRTRLIVINSPSNPTGRVWPDEELRRLADGLAAHGSIHVLTDEVYRELHYLGSPPASIGRYHPNTLVAGSLSKSNSMTGLRIGWLAGAVETIAEAVKVHQFVNTAASTFAQRVALSVFDDFGNLAEHRPTYVAMRERLLRSARAAGTDVIEPEGAFYAFLKIPEPLRRMGSLAIAEAILEERRVVTVPGVAFGESGEGWLRISWVAGVDAVEDALRRIGSWLAEAADR
jgi:aspartate/methionine/tyrosine aminotransferase